MHGSYVATLTEKHALMELKVPPLPIHPRPLDQAEQALRGLEACKVVGRIILKP